LVSAQNSPQHCNGAVQAMPAPHIATQFPAEQRSFGPQIVPQAPQLRLSLFESTHELLQFVRPVAHPAAHLPRLQAACVLMQSVPHAPQFFGSDPRSTQTPPHFAVPVGQPHVPGPHCSVGAHVVPHAPQFEVSLPVSTHAWPHFMRPVAQVVVHWLKLQTSFAPHAGPQAPQFFGSERVSVHAPLHLISVVLQTSGPASASASAEASGFVLEPVSVPAPSVPVGGMVPSVPLSGCGIEEESSSPQAGTPTATAVAASMPSAIVRNQRLCFIAPR
jgi:hypothetical protein